MYHINIYNILHYIHQYSNFCNKIKFTKLLLYKNLWISYYCKIYNTYTLNYKTY